MSAFGKRGVEAGIGTKRPMTSSRPLNAASPHVITRDRSGNVVERGDVPKKPVPALVFVELHWPKFVGAAAAAGSMYLSLTEGKVSVFFIVFAAILSGLFFYAWSVVVRRMLNSLHAVRTKPFQSPAYMAGALVGFGYFVYSTFLSPSLVLGLEVGAQVAFHDGLQLADGGAIALLLLKAAGMAAVGGMAFQFIARRAFGAGNATQNGG